MSRGVPEVGWGRAHVALCALFVVSACANESTLSVERCASTTDCSLGGCCVDGVCVEPGEARSCELDVVTTSVIATPADGLRADGLATSTVSVVLRDAHGRLIPRYEVELVASGTGNLTSAPCPVTSLGSCTFTLASTVAEQKTLSFRLTRASEVPREVPTSTTVRFVPGPTVALGFLEVPAELWLGEALDVVAGPVDAHGNATAELDGQSVALALERNAMGETLAGGQAAQVAFGRASFAGLSLASPGRGYRLVASAPGFAPVVSPPLAVRVREVSSLGASAATVRVGEAVTLTWSAEEGPTPLVLWPSGPLLPTGTSAQLVPFASPPAALWPRVTFKLVAGHTPRSVALDLAVGRHERVVSTGSLALRRALRSPDGGLVVTGTFGSSVTLAAGGPTELTVTASGPTDGLIAKLSATGQALWARQLASTGTDTVRDAVLLASGDVAVTGSFTDSWTVGGSFWSAGQTDGFVAVYAPDGTARWIRRLGSNTPDVGRALAPTLDGGLVVCGDFGGQSMNIESSGAGAFVWSPSTNPQVFVIRFSAGGAVLWARAVTGTGAASCSSVAVRDDGRVAIAGTYMGTLRFADGPYTTATSSSSSSFDAYVLSFDRLGFARAPFVASGAQDDAEPLLIVEAEGYVFGTTFSGSYTLDRDAASPLTVTASDGEDVLVARLSDRGAVEWVRRITGAGQQSLTSLAVSQPLGVVVTGALGGGAAFLDAAGQSALDGLGAGGAFVAGLSGAEWAWRVPLLGEVTLNAASVTRDGEVTLAGALTGAGVVAPMGEEPLALAGNSGLAVSLSPVGVRTAAVGATGLLAAWRAGPRSASASGSAEVVDVATAADGTVVALGRFSGSSYFGSGPPQESPLVSAGDDDVFLALYAPDGALLRASRWGGAGTDVPGAVAVLDTGDIVAASYFAGSLTLDNATGTDQLTADGSSPDILVRRLTPSGVPVRNEAWKVELGASALPPLRVTRREGGFALSGSFAGTLDPRGASTLFSDDALDVFVLRFGYDLVVDDAESYGGTGDDLAYAIAERATGLVLTGSVPGPAWFDGFSAADSAGEADLFVAALDATLSVTAFATFSCTTRCDGRDVATLPDGAIALVGTGRGNLSLGAGPGGRIVTLSTGQEAAFLAVLEPTLSARWVRVMESATTVTMRSVAPLAGGDLVAVGDFTGSLAAETNLNVTTTLVPSGAGAEAVLLRYDVLGRLMEHRVQGGPSSDGLLAATALPDSTLVAVGSFVTEVSVFDPPLPALLSAEGPARQGLVERIAW